METELKLSCVDSFTSKINKETCDFKNTFTSRIIIDTASYIGDGLDSKEVYEVITIGFLESMLNLIQEMGRCGCDRSKELGVVTDVFVVIININDCIHMLERVCAQDETIDVSKKLKNYLKML